MIQVVLEKEVSFNKEYKNSTANHTVEIKIKSNEISLLHEILDVSFLGTDVKMYKYVAILSSSLDFTEEEKQKLYHLLDFLENVYNSSRQKRRTTLLFQFLLYSIATSKNIPLYKIPIAHVLYSNHKSLSTFRSPNSIIKEAYRNSLKFERIILQR